MTIRPELSRQFVAGHKRRRMMDAIAELTAEQGYEATKIADIVRRAAVARKTLYDNFDGKEDLFLSALDATQTEMRVALEEACQGGDSREDKVVAGLAAVLEYIAANPAASRMLMLEAISSTQSSARLYDAGLRQFVDLLRRNAPEGADLPETTEDSVVGGVAWILQQQIRRGKAESARELLPELSQFILAPFAGARPIGEVRRRK